MSFETINNIDIIIIIILIIILYYIFPLIYKFIYEVDDTNNIIRDENIQECMADTTPNPNILSIISSYWAAQGIWKPKNTNTSSANSPTQATPADWDVTTWETLLKSTIGNSAYVFPPVATKSSINLSYLEKKYANNLCAAATNPPAQYCEKINNTFVPKNYYTINF